jgi:hypothetical protein
MTGLIYHGNMFNAHDTYHATTTEKKNSHTIPFRRASSPMPPMASCRLFLFLCQDTFSLFSLHTQSRVSFTERYCWRSQKFLLLALTQDKGVRPFLSKRAIGTGHNSSFFYITKCWWW